MKITDLKILRIKGESTGKTYYTIIGNKTNEDFYGDNGDFTKLLQTNGNGKVFKPHIEKTEIVKTGYKHWEEIHFEQLPKVLQKNFFEEWNGRFLNN